VGVCGGHGGAAAAARAALLPAPARAASVPTDADAEAEALSATRVAGVEYSRSELLKSMQCIVNAAAKPGSLTDVQQDMRLVEHLAQRVRAMDARPHAPAAPAASAPAPGAPRRPGCTPPAGPLPPPCGWMIIVPNRNEFVRRRWQHKVCAHAHARACSICALHKASYLLTITIPTQLQYDPNEMYLLACHPGGGYVMGGRDMQTLYIHGKARHMRTMRARLHVFVSGLWHALASVRSRLT
jgi:hypothetical protein